MTVIVPEKLQIDYPENELFVNASTVVGILAEAGYPAYWVGGAVRDLVLGITPGDVDIVTVARPEQLLELFPDSELIGLSFGVVLVKFNNMSFEVATCREERIYLDGRRPEEIKFTTDFVRDLQRRDFTVNAMLYDPQQKLVLDYTGGLQDIKRQLIRVIGDSRERFTEDYLRMFRAVRFASRLGFELDKAAVEAITAMSCLAGKLAPERVRDELEMMLCGASPVRALELLKQTGLLAVWLPEVDRLSGIEQPAKYHPEGDVWQHTLLMFENLSAPASPELAWSILLHDIGKVPAFSLDEDNIPHFFGHEVMGSEMVDVIAGRLRFSNSLRESVAHAVRNHMRFASVQSMRKAKLKRLLAEENFAMELELHRLDCLSSNGLMGTWEFLTDCLQSMPEPELPELLLNGRDLIKMGYTPGPEFKRMLERLMDAQLEGWLSERSQAIEWIKREYPLKNKN